MLTHIFFGDVHRRWHRSGHEHNLVAKAQMVRHGLQHIHAQIGVVHEHVVARSGGGSLNKNVVLNMQLFIKLQTCKAECEFR